MTDDPTAETAARETYAEIARRAAVLHTELERAVAIFVHGRAEEPARPPIGGPTGGRPDLDADPDSDDNQIDLDALESTYAGWRHLVPADPGVRAALAGLVTSRFGADAASRPRLAAALDLGHGAVPGTAHGRHGAVPGTAHGRHGAVPGTAHGRHGAVPGTAHGPAVGGSPSPALAGALERVDLPAGATLFEQGAPGDSLYVISRGRLRLVIDDGGELSVRELGPDQTVGERALITGDARQGTVVAVRDSVLYRLGKEDFERLALSDADVTHTMLVTLARHLSLRPSRGRAAVVPQHVAVVPAGPDGPARLLAEALVSFMSEFVTIALVTPESVAGSLGEGAVDADPASRLGVLVQDHLAALDARHDHVVRLADADGSPWSLKSAAEADLVLLVGRAGSTPDLNPLETLLFDGDRPVTRARCHLVLVEAEAEVTPRATSPWLERRTVEMCHHLHLGWRSHFARLARFVVGAPVGLVLSGGAVRAYAHVGVLRALRAASIPVDVVAGTSAGALVGGQFAMGWSPERIEQVGREVFGGPRRKLLDFVPPFTSLIGSARFNAVLDGIFGDVRFEDLWIQFLCTTTDLTSATGCTHRRGRLRPFVRASCSLPMVLPPVTHGGHLLADGGIVNNLPVDPLLAVCTVGTLIAVNVSNAFYPADEAYNYEDSLPLGRVLNGRLNPFAEPLIAPGMIDVLMRSLEIGSKSIEPAQIAKADLYVRPDVARYGYTEVSAMAELVAAGERATLERLTELGTPAIPFT